MRCDDRSSGGFHRDFGIGIKLCANQFRNRDHVEDTLAHGNSPEERQQLEANEIQKWYMLGTISGSKSNTTIYDI